MPFRPGTLRLGPTRLWARQAGVIVDDRQKARDFIPAGGPLTRPVHTQMAAAISGFYFGGGLAK